MQLHPVDILIIIFYLVLVIAIGFLIRKKAGENLESYFLSGRAMPWYFLGLSNASSMFDVTGTMWFVAILFVYGLKGAWLPWLWPTFNQVFLMIYLAVWIRRSGVVTGAQWMETRFGNSRGGELSRLSIVVFALVSVIGFLSYAYQGIGKFAAVLLPWGYSPETYGVILMIITTIYVILGGMYSVVFTDIIQFVMLTIASLIIGVVAMVKVAPEQLAAAVPKGWHQLFFGWHLNLNWQDILPPVNQKIASDGFELFGIVWMMILFKGLLVSMAGTAPNYDMQRVLATRKPREASFMSGIVSVALIPRWFMIGGITVLGLVYFMPQLKAMGPNIDLEMLMPYVIQNFLPVGAVGIIISGLLASYMSTFDSTVNAGAAYVVNDIYVKYFNPAASQRKIIRMSYLASFGIVLLGIFFGLMSTSIHTVMQFIVSGLYGSYTAPNILKWHWWRFNAYGYFWGMVSGLAVALALPVFFPSLNMLIGFFIIFLISMAISIVVSLFTEPDDVEVLKSFYKSVRPWGFWKTIHQQVVAEDPQFKHNSSWQHDLLNVAVGIVWQFSLVLLPIYLIIKQFDALAVTLLISLVTSYFLKKNWLNRLED
ncbi:MAG: Na+:solute symporter [Caldisericaceae bacterium]|nr:Na+:solute symporter [Caldisericaceae bacterium]